MVDRGIIFSAPMVRALLAGRKTQTRRVLTAGVAAFGSATKEYWRHGDFAKAWPDAGIGAGGYLQVPAHPGYCPVCDEMGWDGTVHRLHPHVRIADRLYVRESWRVGYGHDGYREDLGRCAKPSEYDPAITPVEYLADGTRELGGRSWPSIFLPRWASRIWLGVTDVRVQRLQEISEADAIAEGIIEYEPTEEDPAEFSYVDGGDIWNNATSAYATLWDSLHTEPGTRWEDNPWIVATSFTVHHGNIDAEPPHG